MSDAEDFTLVMASSHHKIFDDFEEVRSGHSADLDTTLQKALRQQYPELNLTVTTVANVNLLLFAAAGNATAALDIKDEAVKRLRYFHAGNARQGVPDQLLESRTFAKYFYKWADEYFIVYIVVIGIHHLQYILKEPSEGESTFSQNGKTDTLITAVGVWQKPVEDPKYIYIYDGHWTMSKALYNEIQKANWKDVILNENMKKTLTDLMHKFFDSEDIYRDLDVPWKRGVIFHGPAGNGKTISIKALMHSLFVKYGDSIPSLYVKSAPRTYDISMIFRRARAMAPCLLIFEDIDSIVTRATRSYFFNEVDGLENNDGLFMIASTNHLDQLDPGLSSRPSRFDRKYLFPLPSESERVMYCEYWREKLRPKPSIKYPKKLSNAIAGITADFSFAYLKEAFVATLVVIAGNRSENIARGGSDNDDDRDLDDFELWREMKRQVKLLREDMDNKTLVAGFSTFGYKTEEDLSWRDVDHEGQTHASTASGALTHSTLWLRGQQETSSSKVSVGLATPDNLYCDFQNAPLMTDGGMFLDSKFHGYGIN